MLLAGCCIASVSPCLAQGKFTYKAVIQDSLTQEKLSDVRIYAGTDTVGSKNRPDGSFQLSVKKGSTVRFRKTGYRWLNLVVSEDNAKIIEMIPSKKSELHDQFDEVEINGKLVSKEEWNDINMNYFIGADVGVERLNNGNAKLIIKKMD